MKIVETYARFFLCLVLALTLAACGSNKGERKTAEKSPVEEKLDLQKRVSYRMQLAVEYYQQGQAKVALEEIRQVLLIAPDTSDAYSLRALISMDANDNQPAEEDFLRAIKLAPANSDLGNNYGWFLCQTGREKLALTYFERVLKDPNYPTPSKVLNNAGVCSLRLKDLKGAEAYFMQGFKEQPGNPSINANLAKVYFDRGEHEKARFYIQRVVKAEILTADVLWLAIKIENKLGDEAAVNSLGTQLRRRHPTSKEFADFQRGAFNE